MQLRRGTTSNQSLAKRENNDFSEDFLGISRPDLNHLQQGSFYLVSLSLKQLETKH